MGPPKEVIKAIVEMKQRNSRFGCPRIAQQSNLAFGLHLDKDTVRRVLAVHYKPDPGNHGPYWLTAIGHAKDSLWTDQYSAAQSARSARPTSPRVGIKVIQSMTNTNIISPRSSRLI
jgi:hypothetical protein